MTKTIYYILIIALLSNCALVTEGVYETVVLTSKEADTYYYIKSAKVKDRQLCKNESNCILSIKKKDILKGKFYFIGKKEDCIDTIDKFNMKYQKKLSEISTGGFAVGGIGGMTLLASFPPLAYSLIGLAGVFIFFSWLDYYTGASYIVLNKQMDLTPICE